METTIDKATKKKLGSFYSPALLARYVASKVNDLIPRSKDRITILDPAVGTGELLIEMFYTRQEQLDTYIGIDVDQIALKNSRNRLDEVGVNCKLLNFDALKLLLPNNIDSKAIRNSQIKEIDCIISNPPWGAEIAIDQKELSNYKTAIGQFDIYDLFLEMSLDILSDGGVYAFIVPDSIFRKEHGSIRKFLLETTTIKIISRIGEFFFEGVHTSVTIIIGVKGYTPKNYIQCVHLSNDISKKIVAENISILSVESNYSHVCEQDLFINDNYNFAIDIVSEDLKLMKHLDSFPKLKSCLISTRGVELSKKGNVLQCPHCNLWQPFPAVKNTTIKCSHCKHTFYSNTSIKSTIIGSKEDLDNPLPFLRGEDLSRYSYLQKLYIEFNKAGINYKPISLYENPKILVRKTGVGITAVLDYNGNVVNQVVYILYLRNNVSYPQLSLEFFIAILNSRVITYYIIKKYGSNKWCSHPYVSQEMVDKLPIPDFNTFSAKDWESVVRIKSIVKEIYDSSLKAPTPDIDIELERLILKLFRLDRNDFSRIMKTINSVEQLAPFRRLLNISCREWDLDI